jgi:hypothetical protein
MNLLPKAFCRATVCVLIGAGMTISAVALYAQTEAPIAPSSANGQAAATPNWTTQQLLTSTVHQAWVLSGRNEATFFEMVRTLAEISAQNRGVSLPDTKAAGEEMGEYIKNAAKADTDQLLYAVVDKAVMTEANKGPTPAGTRSGNADER